MLSLVAPQDILSALDAIYAGATAAQLESERLEFKEESDTFKRTLEIVADAVVCLANSHGGTVALGVSDRLTGADALLGVSSRLTPDALALGVFERTRPSLSVPVDELFAHERRLLVVTVPKGATIYANAKGTATRRLGAACLPFPPEQQRQALTARGMVDWSAEPAGTDTSAVDTDALRRLRRLLIAAGKDEVSRLDDRRMLRDLRLVVDDEQLTNAGLLLVGTEDAIADHVPTYGFAYQFRPSPGQEASSRLRGQRNVLAATELLLEAVQVRAVVHPINLSGGIQLQVADYPATAVRELVVNALVHRDYQRDGAVEVEHSPDLLAVTSPGGLVYGITPANILTHPSTPRNRLLLEVVTLVQLAERTGQGIDRVYRELLRKGGEPPMFTDSGTQVRAVIRGSIGNDTFARFVNELPADLASDVDVLLALTGLRSARAMGASELSVLSQRPAIETQLVWERMADAGLVAPTRGTTRRPFPSYALTPEALAGLGRAVAYHRQGADVRDDKIVDHVREFGYVTNQALRRMLDIKVHQARDVLRDLQQRGVLVKLDDRAGGPGIRYGPGPSFPARRRSRPKRV
jgi:ATP-dependent DNA helicase RecG